MAEVEEFVWELSFPSSMPHCTQCICGTEADNPQNLFLSLFQPMGCEIPLILIWSPLTRGSLTFWRYTLKYTFVPRITIVEGTSRAFQL